MRLGELLIINFELVALTETKIALQKTIHVETLLPLLYERLFH